MTVNIIQDALEQLIRVKKIELRILECVVEQDPLEAYYMGGIKVPVYKREPELRLTLVADKAHTHDDGTPWFEHVNLHYCIFGTDLDDGTLGTPNKIDKLAKITMNLDIKDRQKLRLAWIIWNGYLYAVEHIQLKEALDAGWHPRVTRIETQY